MTSEVINSPELPWEDSARRKMGDYTDPTHMDLIRRILFEVEEHADGSSWIDLSIDGYNEGTISEHVKMLADAGYIQAKNLPDLAFGDE